MKKLLLASSILAATAGFAAAEVSLSGNGRMGLVYDGSDTYFSARARVAFALSGETDGGLSFGASFRADNAGGAAGSTAMNAGSIYISGAFGKISMGDVGSAANDLVGDVSYVGYTSLGSHNEEMYLLGDLYDQDTSMEYSYTSGPISVALSAQQMNGANDPGYSVAVKYATDAYSVALGYESADFNDGHESVSAHAVSLGGSATFGAITLKGNAIQYSYDGDSESAYAVSADYTSGPMTLTAYYRDASDLDMVSIAASYLAGAPVDVRAKYFGLGVAYDLGGGATVKGGVVSVSPEVGDNETLADVGITMSF